MLHGKLFKKNAQNTKRDVIIWKKDKGNNPEMIFIILGYKKDNQTLIKNYRPISL